MRIKWEPRIPQTFVKTLLAAETFPSHLIYLNFIWCAHFLFFSFTFFLFFCILFDANFHYRIINSISSALASNVIKMLRCSCSAFLFCLLWTKSIDIIHKGAQVGLSLCRSSVIFGLKSSLSSHFARFVLHFCT